MMYMMDYTYIDLFKYLAKMFKHTYVCNILASYVVSEILLCQSIGILPLHQYQDLDIH